MTTKPFTVSIYTASFSKNDMPSNLAKDLFCTLCQDGDPVDIPAWHNRGYTYELVAKPAGTGCYKGIVKKFGRDPLPHAGKPKQTERKLDIKADESTIERSHFLYFPKNHILVWQENKAFGQVTCLNGILSESIKNTVTFNPVLTTEETRSLMLEQHKPKVIEFAVASPTNSSFFDPNNYSDRTLRMMQDLGAMTGSFRISANAQGIKGRCLDAAKTLKLVDSLLASGDATKVRLELENISHPVDLFSDRLKEKFEVEMSGRYPIEDHIYEQLAKAKDRFAEELSSIFG